MLNKKIIAVDIYLERRKQREHVGQLLKNKSYFIFSYNQQYARKHNSIAIGPDLPLSLESYRSKKLFTSFEDRIPSKKNPAYEKYCDLAGIATTETDLITLVATLGQKGPSSFIFAPVRDDQFTREALINFRKDLDLSIREFADLFNCSPSTVHRIEIGKSEGKDTLKRIGIYYQFPEVALYEVQRIGIKINDKAKSQVINYLKNKKTSV